MAMERPQAVAMRASAMPPETLVAASCSSPTKVKERMMPVTVPRRPRSGARVMRVPEDPLEAFAAFEFSGGAELHGAQEGGVGVEEAVVDGAEEGVAESEVSWRARSKSPAAMASKVFSRMRSGCGGGGRATRGTVRG